MLGEKDELRSAIPISSLAKMRPFSIISGRILSCACVSMTRSSHISLSNVQSGDLVSRIDPVSFFFTALHPFGTKRVESYCSTQIGPSKIFPVGIDGHDRTNISQELPSERYASRLLSSPTGVFRDSASKCWTFRLILLRLKLTDS